MGCLAGIFRNPRDFFAVYQGSVSFSCASSQSVWVSIVFLIIILIRCSIRHDPDFDKSTLPSMDNMTPGQRCVARFCQGSQEYKNGALKIIPGIADGPWVVKSVVGNKPAIIGNKLPGMTMRLPFQCSSFCVI
jgi:hypothetical protein